jgi:hypothetical protein
MERRIKNLVKNSFAAIAATPVITDPTGGPARDVRSVELLVGRLQSIVNTVAGILAFIVIIWGAVLYATAGGDTEKAAQGKKVLLYGLGGAVAIVLSVAIVKGLIIILGGSV